MVNKWSVYCAKEFYLKLSVSTPFNQIGPVGDCLLKDIGKWVMCSDCKSFRMEQSPEPTAKAPPCPNCGRTDNEPVTEVTYICPCGRDYTEEVN